MARPTSNGNTQQQQTQQQQANSGGGHRFHCSYAGCAFGAQKSFKKEIFLKQVGGLARVAWFSLLSVHSLISLDRVMPAMFIICSLSFVLSFSYFS